MSALVIIKAFGLIGIGLAVFLESGLFFGFFLPGDSLLFIAGLLSVGGLFDIRILIIVCFVSAVAGDTVGYFMGHKWGRRFFEKEEGLFFKRDNLMKAEDFYDKYGKYTIIIARFVPIIRTFAPIVAGISSMNYFKFLIYNVLGGALWVASLVLIGYFLGTLIPNPDKYVLLAVAMIVIISFAPVLYKFISHKIKSSV